MYDLGSGDGRIVFAAERRHGARGAASTSSRCASRRRGRYARKDCVAGRVRASRGRSAVKSDIGEASVVTLYLLPSLNLRLRPKLLAEFTPGTRILSYGFDMGDWRPDATHSVGSSTVYLWTIPERN